MNLCFPEVFEHSPSPASRSNDVAAVGRTLLMRACRELAHLAAGAPPFGPVLRAVLEATGMERAFVVSCAGREGLRRPRIEASSSQRLDGPERPSSTIVRRALASARPLVCLDARSDERLAEGPSVRALSLRSVIAAPVPTSPPPVGVKAALVLDSRFAPLALPGVGPYGGGVPRCDSADRLPAAMGEVLEAFAALVGLLLQTTPGPSGAGRACGPTTEPELVGRSQSFSEMLDWVRRIAPYDFPVVVTGESGSGKEGIARALHRISRRGNGPFLAINCAAFPETLLESELFGAVRGAYTGSDRDRPGLFRKAHNGTLLLDEIGDMPLPMQAKLLRVLQHRRLRPVGGDEEVDIDVRTIAATHRQLSREVAMGRFRADLFYRIAVVEVRVPPLRERAEDLQLLAEHLISRLAREHGLARTRLSGCALRRLRAYDWPGNVRELQATLLRAMLRARNSELLAGDLDLPEPGAIPGAVSTGRYSLERSMIEWALDSTSGNVARAAARVGWSRQKLYRRISALDIERKRGR